MNDNQNLTIGVLTITGVVLLVAVLLGGSGLSRQAQAIGQTDRGGDYILVTSQYSPQNEVVFITDAAARRVNMYSYDSTQREIVFWDSQDLGKLFGTPPRK
jgi:hypothetical protein